MAEEGVVAPVAAGTCAVADPAAAALAAAEALPDHNGNRVETLAARRRVIRPLGSTVLRLGFKVCTPFDATICNISRFQN
jgi:hypothetical protein